MGNYIIHRDYTTSDAVNRFLNGDGRVFFVQRAVRRSSSWPFALAANRLLQSAA